MIFKVQIQFTDAALWDGTPMNMYWNMANNFGTLIKMKRNSLCWNLWTSMKDLVKLLRI